MKIARFLAMFLLVAVALVACAPVSQGLVALPGEGKTLILTLVSAALTWLLLKVSELLKIDLSGYAAPLAAAVAPLLITIAEFYLGMIPAQYDSLVETIIHFVVLLIGSVGSFVIVGKVKAGQTRGLLK